ncbi:Arp4p [Sugiyamaella lignohabitans]|uniref:Actin n=1 Tax=Sugiyamaella lignohabitans TaxID=796027 RepID=A0A167EZV1_9ASCO|nr:Arp4p [Sugiyamaella lignohabitans]ANB14652.1 Arp4p [Sugiyamaella lignohabitans]
MEIASPMTDGIVSDWDATEKLWRYGLEDILGAQVTEQPLLITEQIWNTDENRKKAMEVAFESLDTPAFYIAKRPVCTLFASGKGSGLVVDIGADIASVTPVLDGLTLFKTSKRSRHAGTYINKHIEALLKASDFDLTPRYLVAARQTGLEPGEKATEYKKRSLLAPVTASFHDFQVSRLIEEFKESMAQVQDTPYTDEAASQAGTDVYSNRVFEFPDGSSVEYGSERFKVAEPLFKPRDFLLEGEELLEAPEVKEEDGDDDDNKDDSKENGKDADSKDKEKGKASKGSKDKGQDGDKDKDKEKPTEKSAATAAKELKALVYTDRTQGPFTTTGISDMIIDAINSCDVDIRANLANNVIITGGTSLIQGFTDRVNEDLVHALPGYKIRIHAPGNLIERKFSAWIGGSILASLGTFHQLWISKKEYEEVGVSKLLEKRFR